jgi:hypothetical protein
MLRQRIASLVLVLVGIRFGLVLPRPWAEVPEAEAAGSRNFRCVFTDNVNGSMVLHNPTEHDAALLRFVRDQQATIMVQSGRVDCRQAELSRAKERLLALVAPRAETLAQRGPPWRMGRFLTRPRGRGGGSGSSPLFTCCSPTAI